jgi:predicted metal-dependent hydrolase
MAQKIVEVDGLGPVLFSKRRGTKNLRISIRANGQIRVGIPHWAPYSAGVAFVKSKKSWIATHQSLNIPILLKNGDRIGKAHRLYFKTAESTSSVVRTRVTKTEIIISTDLPGDSQEVQQKAISACERALKQQSLVLFPRRLDELCAKTGLKYKSLKIAKLTSRWGSCSSKKDITLSYFLVQLPWESIDYVILHELTHTNHLNHSKSFWAELSEYLPSAKTAKKQMKHYQPKVTPL